MKTIKCAAIVAAAALVLTGCSQDDKSSSGTSSSAASSAAETSAAPALPSAADLNAVLARALDPAIPAQEKTNTVVGGEQAPLLFDALTASKQQTGAQLQVVDPVLPGVLPNSVSANVNFTLPGREPQLVSGVEFVQEGGVWKLDQRWACTLVQAALPAQVPPQCAEALGGAPAGAPAQSAPAPAPGAAPESAAPAPAPAPAGSPTP